MVQKLNLLFIEVYIKRESNCATRHGTYKYYFNRTATLQLIKRRQPILSPFFNNHGGKHNDIHEAGLVDFEPPYPLVTSLVLPPIRMKFCDDPFRVIFNELVITLPMVLFVVY